MANYRDRRVAQEILKEVTHLLQTKIRDPRVQDITITDVSVTGDLQQATVFFIVFCLMTLQQNKKLKWA